MKMNKNVLLWLIIIGCSLGVSLGMVSENEIENRTSTAVMVDHRTKKLSRQKRYLAFPEGSSISVSNEWGTFNSLYLSPGNNGKFIISFRNIKIRLPFVLQSAMWEIPNIFTSVGV